ncbi:multiple epidermal growth factor-like domains protein 8 [Octopus sinensis]|nr:multiple epidermal growth factor-like domains protein 8 [Octopus sinensis]
MDVDSDYCFDPDDRNACGSNYKPLLKGRTLFYAVQPKYLNVNIRITIDVTQGGVDVYFSPDDKTFVVDLNRETWFHEVKLDKSLKFQAMYHEYMQYTRNDVNYYLRKEVAKDTNKFITLEQANTTLNVTDVRFRLVITLPLDVHDLEKSQFYIIIYGRGDINSNTTYGKLFFRQDQPHIDLFVFFSVFFSCFFLFLAICVLIWKIKQTVDAQRSRQQRAREMQHMASRPFAGVLVLVDHDVVLSNPTTRKLRVNKPTARSPQCPEVNLMHQCLREDHFSISPIAIEPTEDGIASVATVVFQLPGGGSTASKVCLGSALTMRMCPGTANLRMTMRRRPSSSLA